MSKKNKKNNNVNSTKVTGCKLNFADNTMTVTYKFAAAMNDITSPEFKYYKRVMKECPQLELVVQAGKTYTKPRENKRLTYKNMEIYISTFDNADELLQRFKLVQKKSKVLKSPYAYVSDWFKAQFPDYKKIPEVITAKERIIVKSAPNIDRYEKKAAQKELLKNE